MVERHGSSQKKSAVLSRFEESVGTNGEPEHSLAFYCLKWKVLINAGIRGHIPKVFMPTPAPKIYKVLPWCNTPQILPLVFQWLSPHGGSHGSITSDTMVTAGLGEGRALGHLLLWTDGLCTLHEQVFVCMGIRVWSTHVWFYRRVL